MYVIISINVTCYVFQRGNWVCAQSSLNPKPNLNKHITDKLEVNTYTCIIKFMSYCHLTNS